MGKSIQSQSAKEDKTVELTISVSASLQDALKEIEKQYKEKEPNIKLSFNFGASEHFNNKLNKVHLLIYSSQQREDKFQTLVKKDSLMKKGKNLLGNELVLVVPKDSSLTKIQDLKDEKIKNCTWYT